MSKNKIEQLPIVSDNSDKILIGLLDSQDLISSSLDKISEEQEREEGRFSYYINLLPSRRKNI